MKKTTIVIIGKPNVGKSTLFNRLIGKKKSIVSPIEGITRDRIYGSFEWLERHFELIDTGGYIPKNNDLLNNEVKFQSEIAKNSSDLILFMVDGNSDISINDQILSSNIKKSNKPCLLVVNKIDNLEQEKDTLKFYDLGIGEPIPISSESGRQVGILLDKINDFFNKNNYEHNEINHDLSLAIIGMPNVGKSSFVNKILNEKKSIVSHIPGTTRDSIDSSIKYFNKDIRLIDTAGLRKKSKIIDAIEFYSIVRTSRSIEDCDVAILLIDASKGFHGQDKNIIRTTIDKGKGLIVVINKWDLIEKDTYTMKNFKDDMEYDMAELKNYPIIFISVINNLKLRNVLDESLKVYEKRKKQLKTNHLNEVFQKIINNYPPPSNKGKEIKIKYITQIRKTPPLLGVYSNHPHLISKTYEKYLINKFREHFDFKGVPVNISFRKK